MKMATRTVEIVLLATAFAAIATARPQGYNLEKSVEGSIGGLPFLQFADGGVRVNFAGYHAQAGLGGLLGGSNAKGGLHASAGTPSGAHASAGLGGLLGGDNGNTGGGLHAKAGLGNGGPEAAAGLGGVLNGNSNSNAAGGLYAGATLGNAGTVQKEVAAAPSASAGLYGSVDAGASSSSSASSNGVPIKSIHVEKQETPAFAGAGLAGGLYAGAGTVGDATVHKSYEKNVVPYQKTVVIEKRIVAPASATADVQGGLYAGAGAGPSVVVDKVVYPARWHYRKHVHGHPHVLKTVTYNTAPVARVGVQSEVSASAGLSGGISKSVGGEAVIGGGVHKGGSLFDDIFNIPISTLRAVNQLLNNKGR